MASLRMLMTVRQFSSSLARSQMVNAPIQVFGIEGRYATALYSAASKEKKLEVVEKDFKKLQTLLKENTNLAEFIVDPTLKQQEKASTVSEVLKMAKVDKLTTNTFAALADNHRLKNLNGVMNAFNLLMSAHRGEVIANITTAKPLDAKSSKELESALQAFLKKNESLQINTKVDPSLVGGMVIEIGDKYIDMSMVSKIKTYTNLIKEAV